MSVKEFKSYDKSGLKSLDIALFSGNLPDLKNAYESKSVVISQWLEKTLKNGVKSGIMGTTDLLPLKTEFAYALGVSVGTVQNAFRALEDRGYVLSKQCMGTMIANWVNPTHSVRKLTSKRDIAVDNIKKFINMNKIKLGSSLPSTRVLASVIDSSPNTTRFALEKLCMDGVLSHSIGASGENGWVLKTYNFMISDNQEETLVQKVSADLKNYITNNFKMGSKMPSHATLASILKVSVKTIHEGLKVLIDEGILLSRRGRYGTSVMRMPEDAPLEVREETSIFASAQETAFYHYEKTQNYIKKLICENYEIGAKLPSILQLSAKLDLSPNTIRKAFNNLADAGYLRFARGRYGGTFVVDIPENTSGQAFKWLAVNPIYVETSIMER